jgi:hypothetical protein
MAKYSGKIGYVIDEEVRRGIFEPKLVERIHYGNLIKNYKKLYSSSDTPNDGIDISNSISIVADPFAMTNFQSMTYATFMGKKWKITNVEVQYPRLIISLGGMYNGDAEN